MIFSPINKESTSDKVIKQIKAAVENMNLKPGDRLPSEMEMALNFHVGRSTVREALKVLIHLGVLDRKGRQTIVTNNAYGFNEAFIFKGLSLYHDYKNSVDMIEVLLFFEAEICKLAAQRAEGKDIKDLQDCLSRMRQDTEDIDKFLEADLDFHMALARMCKNNILIRMHESTKAFRRETMQLINKYPPGILYKSLRYHEDILRAVADHRYAKAGRTMKEHLKDVEFQFKAILRKESAPGEY